MIRKFCDACGEECRDGAGGSRRFEHLAAGLAGAHLGLEVVPLAGGQAGPNNHVCVDCVLKMLWSLAEKLPGSGLAARVRNLEGLEAREEHHQAAAAALQERERLAAAREAGVRAKEAALQDVPALVAPLEEKIRALEAQIVAERRRAEEAARVAAAEQTQREEDERNIPEYVRSVLQRERRRGAA